jgi:hypothetical protein
MSFYPCERRQLRHSPGLITSEWAISSFDCLVDPSRHQGVPNVTALLAGDSTASRFRVKKRTRSSCAMPTVFVQF